MNVVINSSFEIRDWAKPEDINNDIYQLTKHTKNTLHALGLTCDEPVVEQYNSDEVIMKVENIRSI